MPTNRRICFDRIPPSELRRPIPRSTGDPERDRRVRAALLAAKRWPTGSTLRIRFMGGDEQQHDVVRQYAPQWCQHANLTLEFNDHPQAEIRIAFADDGAWSYIATDALEIPADAPTMNFGWLDEGVVLHEFGHALGLIHEHQNPAGGIQWNRENVIRDLSGPPNYWDLATIEHNIFATYSQDLVNGTTFDPESVMLYSFPADWTVDGFHSEPNDVLSDTDRSFIASDGAYPGRGDEGAEIIELEVNELVKTSADIGKPGEEDLFRFAADAAGQYTIVTEGATDVVMRLYGPDSRTTLIAEDDDSAGNRNARIAADLAKGTYYVQVRHYDVTSAGGAYDVVVTR